VTPNHQGDGIPKSNEHNEVIEGEGEVLLLESVAHSRKLESSLKNNNQGLGLRERKRGAQDLDLKGGFAFSEWPTALGGRWGSIYNPDLKRVIGESFHQTSLVRHRTSPMEPFRSLSGIGQVR
jgi:hypothetical protein